MSVRSTSIDWMWGALAIVCICGAGLGSCYGISVGMVEVRELWGKASLKEATWDRQIAIEEAKAVKESAKFLAQAEVARANGVSEANTIIGDSLKGNEAYLRYLWITGLQNEKNKLIYIPTEAGMPILEAGRSVE